jgi:GR25 family glycosyltransferase involved in LPS biosynthesis
MDNVKKTLCLNMIVKDESHVIKNTLENLCSYLKFDMYIICDTGSSDNTIEIIENFFTERNIPGQVLKHEWKDFGHNRTLALQAAYDKTDYLLVFDADDSIVGNFVLPNELSFTAYKLKFVSSNETTYYRPLLLNNRIKWKFMGVLHEYLTLEDEKETKYICKNIDGDYHLISGKTGNRNKDPNKYNKDAKILDDAFYVETDKYLKDRYAFYCAQSYKDANNVDKAIYWYEKVINELNNWTQEKYYACFIVGQLHTRNNNINKALEYYNKSIGFDSDRIECIVNMAEYFYNIKAYIVVVSLYNLYNNYLKPTINPDKFLNKLFLESSKYRDMLEFYTSISAYYCGQYKTGIKACIKIIQNDIIPKSHYYLTISNLQYYKQHLSSIDDNTLMLLFEKVDRVFQSRLNSIDNVKSIINTWKMLYDVVKHKLTAEHKNIEQLKDRFKNKKQVNILLSFTTCKRYDLFKQTINSILNTWMDIDLVDYWLCVDDNSSENDRQQMSINYPWLNFIFKNKKQKGHRESMNIIYSKLVELKPKYWIHIEDDFLFHTKENYIKLGIMCLEKYHNNGIRQVLFNRSYAETIDDYAILGTEKLDDLYLLHEHKTGSFNYRNCHYWKHYSFRPSIIDVSTIIELGNYNSANTFFEADYAEKWYNKGYKSAFFNGITCTHIGKLTSEKNVKNAYDLNNERQFSNLNFNKKSTIKIVNLERRPDRKNYIINTMIKAGYTENDFEIIKAVDGLKLEPTPEIRDLFKGNDFGNRKCFIGCALTHLNLWKQLLLDEKNNYYIILEDDITLTEKFKDKVNYLETKGIFDRCDILFCGYHMFSKDRETTKDLYINNNIPFVNKLNDKIYIGGTFMYSITKQCAQKYIDFINNNGIKHGIDYVMVKLLNKHNIPLYETQPHLCFSEWNESGKTVDSDIQNNIERFIF